MIAEEPEIKLQNQDQKVNKKGKKSSSVEPLINNSYKFAKQTESE